MNKEKTKLFFLLPTLATGGGERVVSELSLNLPKNIEQTIVLFENRVSFPYAGKLISLETPLSLNFLKRFLIFFIRLNRFKNIVKKEKPDYVISLGNSANIINILSSKKAIVRVDMFLSKQCRGFWGKSFKVLVRLFFNKSFKIITVSKAIAGDLVNNFGVRMEKITTIYNPIDVKKIQTMAKEDLEPAHSEIFKNPVIISSGRLTKQKGHWHLIRAFVRAKSHIKNLKLVILGNGELDSYFKELIDDYNFREDVYLLGWQANPFKFIAKSSLFVLPSLWEGLPMVAIESMACSIPVISADFRSGAREILAPDTDFNFETDKIETAEYGILVPVCDDNLYKSSHPLTKEEDALARAIVDTLNDKQLRDKFAKRSVERADNFDIKYNIKSWGFLCEQTIDN